TSIPATAFPVNYTPGERHPLLVEIHGDPSAERRKRQEIDPLQDRVHPDKPEQVSGLHNREIAWCERYL
ncbi:MAG: hypothetical protein M0P17_04365, partial [Methanoculleus sp.]|nr:hypothetical protein [Methanoculleus sp.]